MKSWQRACVCILSGAAGLAANRVSLAADASEHTGATPLSEGEKQKVREFVSAAALAYSKSDWGAAREAYLQAWQLSPHPLIAANLGDVEVKLDLCTEAAAHLQYFLDNVPTGTATEKLSNAKEQFATCRARVTSVVISTNVAGSAVTIDSQAVGEAPIRRPVFLTPGRHKLEAQHGGYRATSRVIEAQAGGDMTVDLRLEEQTPLAKPLPPAEPAVHSAHPASPGDGMGTRTWVTVAGASATVVALGIGVGFRVRANSKHDNAESLLGQLGDTSCEKPTGATDRICGQLRSTWASYDTAVNVSTGAFVTAGVLGAATAVTYFLWPKKPPSERGTNVHFSLAPLARARGVELVGVF